MTGSDHETTGPEGAFERELKAALRARADTHLPERIGRYHIERELGRGGMGTVYLAHDEELQRPVALKLMALALQRDPEARERFFREAMAVSRLDHPGICHLYEVGEAEGRPFMVMRYVRGRTLAELLADADAAPDLLPARNARQVDALVAMFEQVARALHVAHEQGLVHRDIKPANLMICADRQPVVLDFGVAHDSEVVDHALTITGQMIGTPLYMAPEQVLGDRTVDRRADVFALAVTIYETLTGDRPFGAATDHSIYHNVLRLDPPAASRRNPIIGRQLATVLETGMRKDPHRRYRSALAFADDLRAVVERKPIATRAPTMFERLRYWVARNPMAASFVAVLVVSSAAMGLLWRDALTSDSRFQLAANVVRVRELHQRHRALFPSRPERVADLEAWLADAEPHTSRLAAIRAELAAIEDAARSDSLSELLRGLLRDLERELTTLHREVVPFVRERLATASTIERRTLVDAAPAWQRAIASIAEPDGRYAGLRIEPQIGLVPLSADPDTQLWEFAVAETGEIPKRGQRGELQIDADSAIVLVLLPGGTFAMGSTSKMSVPREQTREGTTHRITLDPFFIGKHEVTQAQWTRIMRSNPSRWHHGRPFVSRDKSESFTCTPIHPVEGIYSDDAIEAAMRVALTVPTEAQWEYAARAGSEHDWTTGELYARLRGRMNFADQTYARFESKQPKLPWDDGYPIHAPVGSYRPNGNGLHDMDGNIAEYCRDWRGSYDLPVEPGTGERIVTDPSEHNTRVVRGGSFASDLWSCRVCSRAFAPLKTAGENFGVRFARPLAR